jgi:hypothetical protein
MNRNSRTASVAIAVVMLIAIVGSSIFQLFDRNLNPVQTPAPTQTQIPTFPPPVADLNSITFTTLYMQPSGLFSVPIPNPPAWNSTEPTSNVTRQSVAFRNDLSVIEAYVENPGIPITSTDQLNALYTTSILQGSWSRYSPVRETGRRVEADQDTSNIFGDRVLIDFELGFRQQTFLARHVAWTDGTWVYVVRVVMPDNARDQLLVTLDGVVRGFQANTQFRSTPMDWAAAFDPQSRHLIRFPASWIITDSAPGLQYSISAPDGSVLRLQSRTGGVADETAARNFVTAERTGATVMTVVPLTRGDSTGFGVSYSLTNPDGDSISGYMVLLNGVNETLHFADLRIPHTGVDLNTVNVSAPIQPTVAPGIEVTAEATADLLGTSTLAQDSLVYAQVMSTFWLFPNLAVQIPTPTPIPTAAPTLTVNPLLITPTVPTVVAPTVETTAEATSDATVEATTEATVEATMAAEATTEATAEPTTEVTAEATAAP